MRRNLDQRYSREVDPYAIPCSAINPYLPDVPSNAFVCAREGCGAPSRKYDGYCCNSCSRWDETKFTNANPNNWNFDRHDGCHTKNCHFAHIRFEHSLAPYVLPGFSPIAHYPAYKPPQGSSAEVKLEMQLRERKFGQPSTRNEELDQLGTTNIPSGPSNSAPEELSGFRPSGWDSTSQQDTVQSVSLPCQAAKGSVEEPGPPGMAPELDATQPTNRIQPRRQMMTCLLYTSPSPRD